MTETPAPLEFRLPTEFQRLFERKIYKHRNSSQGDFVAMHLYDDLITINRSPKLIEAMINRKDRVLNRVRDEVVEINRILHGAQKWP